MTRSPTPLPLPTEHHHPQTARRVIGMVAGTVAATILLNLTAFLVLAVMAPNRDAALLSAKWALLRRQNAPVDWLILGDSTGNQGVIPTLLARELRGGVALNLCTFANTLVVNDAWMLEQYVKQQGPPKRGIILIHAYDVYGRTPECLVPLLGAIDPSLRALGEKTPRLKLSLADKIGFYVGAYIPLYYRTETLKILLLHPQFWRYHKNRLPELTTDGFMSVRTPNPQEVKTDVQEHLLFLRKNPPVITPVNRQAITAIYTIARQHRVNLYIAMAPISDGLGNAPCYQEEVRFLDRTIRDLTSNYSINLFFQDPQLFPAHELANADHVIESAAVTYTVALARAIRDNAQ